MNGVVVVPNTPPFEKCAIVIAAELPLGLALNAAAVLSLSLGLAFGDEIVGEDLKDADGAVHRGITAANVPILRAETVRVREIVLGAQALPDLYMVDFSAVAQAARDYESYRAALAAAGTAEHDYAGVAIAGAKKAVGRLTGSLALYR
jgi:hypothetical protein